MLDLSSFLFEGSNILDFKVISKVADEKIYNYVHVYFELHFVDKEIYEYGLHNKVAYMSYCAVLTTRPNISYFFNQMLTMFHGEYICIPLP